MSLELNYEQWGYGPPHPGEVLREQILPRLGLSQRELAARLDIPQKTLGDFLAGSHPVTLAIARRLGLAFGNGPRFWLALQMQHDVWTAEQGDPLDIAPIKIAAAGKAARPPAGAHHAAAVGR